MSSQHRIEKCTLQITLSPKSDLDVVKLLAHDKPRILDAVLAVFDREIPDHHTITLSKIHLDLGTVSRQNFIPTLTERLIALLTAELKNLVNHPTFRALPFSAPQSAMREESLYHISTVQDTVQPGTPAGLLPPLDVQKKWTSFTVEQLLTAVVHYFETGTFPRAVEFLRTADLDALVHYLADENARSFVRAISRLMGTADFHQRASRHLPYDTLVKIAQLVPSVRKSLKAWVAWMDNPRSKKSDWADTQQARLLFLQYFTTPSAEEKTRLQQRYIRKYLATPYGDADTAPTDLPGHDTPSTKFSLGAMVVARGIEHGSYMLLKAFVETISDRYKANGTLLPDDVKHFIFWQYLELIRIHDKNNLTPERIELLMLPDLQRIPGWPPVLLPRPEAYLTAAGRAHEPVVPLANFPDDAMAHWRSFSAFTHVQFYYRYGYFFSEAKQLHAKDLDALINTLLAWDSDKLAHYILTLLDNITYTVRLAETLSTRTLKSMLSASAQVSDALAEWMLWEHVITSLLEKTFFTTVADKVALLHYVGAPQASVRQDIIYDYLLFSFAQQQLGAKLNTMLDFLRTFDAVNHQGTAARSRIVEFLTTFAARENNNPIATVSENLKAFRQYLTDAGSYVAPQAPDHPLHGHWIDLEDRVRNVLEEANVPGREGLLRQLLHSYGDFLRFPGNATWTPEHFQRYMLQEVEHLLAAATLAANAHFLLARIDATATSAIVYRVPVLQNMIGRGIHHTVLDMPALQGAEAFTLFWDAALADEAAVFSLFQEVDVPASFWSELSELLSFEQLHRLLSILAPFQYQELHATGALAENRATTREAFYRTLKTLHDARFTIGTEQLIERVFREAPISLPGDAFPSLAPTPEAASGSSDNASFKGSSLHMNKLADELMSMLAEDISRHRAAAAEEHWRQLYHYFDGALAPYARKRWTSQAWRDSLALDADIDVLIDFTTLLWHNEPSYPAWRNFTISHRHRERWLRAMHRYYFDFLAGTRQPYDPAIFTKSLADFAEALDTSADTAQENNQAMMGNMQEKRTDDIHVLLAELYITTTRREASATPLWQSLYTRHRQELLEYINLHNHPEPLHDSLALDAGLDILVSLSTSLYQHHDTYPRWVAFTESYRQNIELLRKSYRHYFRYLRNDMPESPAKPFHDWMKTLADTLNRSAMRTLVILPSPDAPDTSMADRHGTSFGPSALPPVNTPRAATDADHSTSPYSAADIIIYYLKTGLFIPGSGTADVAALTALTNQYFLEVSPDDNRVMAVALENPEVVPRLTPLLSPAALSLLHAREPLAASLPHYTTDRVATLQQIEATLHYWLYGQWPWWYTPILSPAETASATLGNHLELLVERLTASGHEVAIVQKIAAQLPQAVFVKMIAIRFPAVAGFITRVFSLLEQLPVEGEHPGARPSHTTFAVVYDYLAHTHDANPFSALHFISILARHEATVRTIPESVWIDRMTDLAQTMQQQDSVYWSLYSVLTSLPASPAEAAPTTDNQMPPSIGVSSNVLTTDSASPSFKEAFVAYLRMGIIPVHTPESEHDKSVFIQQLQFIGLHEPAWLTTTLKSLFKNTVALDAYLQRADPLITHHIILALSGTRQQEFTHWQHALESFVNSLPATSDKAAPTPPQATSITTRAFLLLLLQRPAAKITTIQYAQTVLDYSLQHNLVKGLDVLLDKIQQYKASPPLSEHVAIALEVAHAQLVAQARTALLQSLTHTGKKNTRTTSVPDKGTPIAVEGAGIVLLAPFLYMYFNRLGMTENNSFKTPALAVRAVHLLHYLASGETAAPRQAWLYKLLCGVDLVLPLDDAIDLTDHEKEVSESLLHGVLQNWTSLQSKSIDALRETFLQRAGRLEENEMGWNLTVERKSMDILVDWIPWSFSLIKLSWMEKSLAVHWQSDQYRDLMPNNP